MTSEKTAQETKDPDQLRAEIAEIRAELGDTVEALAAKADVKAQAQAKVEQTKQQVREKVEQTKDTLKAKASESTGQLRERAEVGRVKAQASSERGKEALSRYAPWPQVAAGAAAALVAIVVGGRKIQARRNETALQRALRKSGRR